MSVKIIECPRDAMQGLHDFIPTDKKAKYINTLLKAGFDSIDFGSFVSPKVIPQLADTAEVLAQLDWQASGSKLLAIVANMKGAQNAVVHEAIQYVGFPFSVSETFQLRNTNATIAQSMESVKQMQELCVKHGKELVLYISMGFGNPYGDEWNVNIVEHWVSEMQKLGIHIISLSDTIGVADPGSISYLFGNLIPAFPEIEFGAHLHTTPDTWMEKIDAAYTNGCRRFDGAMKGFGGCPMAADQLTGNMATENLFYYFAEKQIETGIKPELFSRCINEAQLIFDGAY